MRRIALAALAVCLSFTAYGQEYKDLIVEKMLKTDTTSIGQKIAYPNFANDEVTILKITIKPGKSTGWHKHDFPVFAWVLKGNLTVEVEGKKNMEFAENSSFAEIINVYHNGINAGTEDVVLVAVYMGAKGKGLSIPKEKK